MEQDGSSTQRQHGFGLRAKGGRRWYGRPREFLSVQDRHNLSILVLFPFVERNNGLHRGR